MRETYYIKDEMGQAYTGQATIAELADGARQHYDKVSRVAQEWHSLIPDAIDAWEREQERLRRPSAHARLRGFLRSFRGDHADTYDGREIQADTIEFHEAVEFHHCKIKAERIICHGGATLYYTTVSDGGIEISGGYELKNTPLARLLGSLRRFFRQLWAASAVIVCPECYADGGWESGACEGCRAREGCQETVLLP